MFVLLLLTFVGCVLVTWLLPLALHSERPYGLLGDVLVGTIAGLVWAVITYQFLSPLIGLSGLPRLLLSAGDAIGLAAVMLWVLRRIRR